MATPAGPPVLSTPDAHIFEEQPDLSTIIAKPNLSDEQLYTTYEIERTISEIKRGRYARVALQFPDQMLPDAPRVFEALREGLNTRPPVPDKRREQAADSLGWLDSLSEDLTLVRLYILADTSYGACCVDEIAAEHIDADAVVHYGRSCLVPTARIPVIYIFTVQPLAGQIKLVENFQNCYAGHQQKIIFMADVTYQHHLHSLKHALEIRGFMNLYTTEIIHDPSSPLPNRTVPDQVKADPSKLHEWHLFHISDPPESLLLTLASRVASIRIYPTTDPGTGNSREPFLASTSRTMNKRYALLTSVSTVSIFGILMNTLSVKNYLHIVEHVKSQIQAAGKKSYTFVVGKINAAKVANFNEIGAWVVIGCWESSLIDSKDYWKPVLTPFELELALKRDNERIWTGEWSSNFQNILDEPVPEKAKPENGDGNGHTDGLHSTRKDIDSEPESVPPEFNLRTGRYVTDTRPMRASTSSGDGIPSSNVHLQKSLIKRAKGDLAVIGGEHSPGAEHLMSKKTWRGLGSDFEIAYEQSGAVVQEGRGGIARGYTHSTASEAIT